MKEVLPELVVTDSDGFLAILYDRSMAVLMEALKELKVDFDDRLNAIDAAMNKNV